MSPPDAAENPTSAMASDPDGASDAASWLFRLLALYVIGLIIAAGFAFCALSYFKVRVNAVLAWFPNDIPGSVSPLPLFRFGQHYFGDFLLPYQWGKVGNPWTDHALWSDTYTPVLNLIFKAFAVLPYRISLWVYLSISGLAMGTPFLSIARVFRLSAAVVFAGLLCIMTYPFLINLDRGNSQVMLVPLLFGVAVAMSGHRWGWASAFIVLAALLKGYPILLLILLMPYKKWRVLITAVTVFALANVAAFAVFPGNFGTTIRAFFTALKGFTPSTPASLIGSNYSLTGCVLNAIQLFGGLNGGAARWVAAHSWTPGIIYLLLVTPILLARHVIPLWARLLTAFSTTQLVVPESHGYTTAYMLVIAALFVQAASSDASATFLFTRHATARRKPLTIAEPLRIIGSPLLIWAGIIAISLTLLPAPWSINDGNSSLATIYSPIAIVGFVAVAYVGLVRSFRLRLQLRRVGDLALAPWTSIS